MQVRFEIGGEIADQLLEVTESRPEGRDVLRMRLPELNEVVLDVNLKYLVQSASNTRSQSLHFSGKYTHKYTIFVRLSASM